MEITKTLDQALRNHYIVVDTVGSNIEFRYARRVAEMGLPFVSIDIGYRHHPHLTMDLINLAPFKLSNEAVNNILNTVNPLGTGFESMNCGGFVRSNPVLSQCRPSSDFAEHLALEWYGVALKDLEKNYPDRSVEARDALALSSLYLGAK